MDHINVVYKVTLSAYVTLAIAPGEVECIHGQGLKDVLAENLQSIVAQDGGTDWLAAMIDRAEIEEIRNGSNDTLLAVTV